jgi:hypothetical protein
VVGHNLKGGLLADNSKRKEKQVYLYCLIKNKKEEERRKKKKKKKKRRKKQRQQPWTPHLLVNQKLDLTSLKK